MATADPQAAVAIPRHRFTVEDSRHEFQPAAAATAAGGPNGKSITHMPLPLMILSARTGPVEARVATTRPEFRGITRRRWRVGPRCARHPTPSLAGSPGVADFPFPAVPGAVEQLVHWG